MHFNEFRTNVESLAKLDVDNLNDIQKLISEYYGKIGTLEFDCKNMFVVRASRNGNREIFSNIQRCSYNPKVSDIPIQRCNYPGQQVFYCSMYTETHKAFTSITCIMETAMEQIKNYKINECCYTLSRWDLKRPLKLWALPFSKLSHLQNDDFKFMSDELKKALKTHPAKKEIVIAYKYMSEVFCKRINKKLYYKISSAFFNFLLTLEQKCDGIAYPSANTERAGINVALNKILVDDKILVGTAATLYFLKRNQSDKKKLSILPCSKNAFPDSMGKLHFYIDVTTQNDFM